MSNFYFDKYKKIRDYRKKFREKILSSDEYIEWMNDFVKKNGSFSTYPFDYDLSKYTSEDRINVHNFYLFFEIIDDYANANYLSPIEEKYGIYYPVHYENMGYLIGCDYGQGTAFDCICLDEIRDGSIDFKKVMNHEKSSRAVFIDKRLDELDSFIDKLYEEDIPLYAIADTASKKVQKIKLKKI